MSKFLAGNYTAPMTDGDLVNLVEGLGYGYTYLSVTPAGTATYSLMTLPAHAIVLACEIKLTATVVATTAVKIGVGPSANPDKYALTGALTALTYRSTIISVTAIAGGGASPEVVLINACDTAGAAAGTLNSGGLIQVKLWYRVSDIW